MVFLRLVVDSKKLLDLCFHGNLFPSANYIEYNNMLTDAVFKSHSQKYVLSIAISIVAFQEFKIVKKI
jgi:hypothetical protein